MNFKYYKTRELILFLLVLSVLYAFLSRALTSQLPDDTLFKSLWAYIDIFSVVSLIMLTLTAINLYGWKWQVFKWLIDIPNLNGRYEGQLTSLLHASNQSIIKDCVLEIRQTGSKLKFFTYFGDPGTNNQTSVGYSILEEIVKEDDGSFGIYQLYTTEPHPLQIHLNAYSGASYLKFLADKKQLDGDYYNDRPSKGVLCVTFTQKKLLSRLRS